MMVFIKDAADLRFVRYNKAGQSLLGYSQDHWSARTSTIYILRRSGILYGQRSRSS